MKKLLIVFSSAVLLLLSGTAFSQDDLFVHGIIKDTETLKKLDGIIVTVFQNGSQWDSYTTSANAKYEFNLPFGYTYNIKFSKTDFVNKTIQFDTRNIPEEDQTGGFRLDMDVSLFKYIDGFDTSILDEPIGKSSFNPLTNAIEFDFEYTKEINRLIEAEFERLEDLAKNFDKLFKQFEELVQKGDNNMTKENYTGAVSKYEQALEIFPDDEPVQKKLADAQSKVDEANALAEREAEYQRFIASGNNNMKNEAWADARSDFEAALNLKPDEKLPKDKLEEIADIIASMADRGKYDDLIGDADNKFDQKNYALAIDVYKAASKVLPDEKYPRDQIKEAQRLLDELLANAAALEELEKRYNDLIKLGDRNFKGKKYEDARRNYVEALALKADEKHPADRIDQIDKILEELAAAEKANQSEAEANAERDRIEKEYKALIDSGNDKFDGDKLEEARNDYSAALELKANEKYPKGRITRINQLLAERNQEAEELAENRDLEEKKRLAEEEAANAKAEREKLAESERQKRLDEVQDEKNRLAEEKRAREEEERLRRERLLSNVDTSKEDEVEKYYREARESEVAARNKSIEKQKEGNDNFLAMKNSNSADRRDDNLDSANNKKDNMVTVHRDGEVTNSQNDQSVEQEKEKMSTFIGKQEDKSKDSRSRSSDKAEEAKKGQDRLKENDSQRDSRIRTTENAKENNESSLNSYEKRNNALRADNEYDVKKKKTDQELISISGEEVRSDNMSQVETEKEDIQNYYNDLSAAANERLDYSIDQSEKNKETFQEIGQGKEYLTEENSIDINKQKESQSSFNEDQKIKSASKRYEVRKELFDKDMGSARDEDDYLLQEGSEDLAEGVSENSYQLGNKIVIERTVKIGNKVDKYRKVVSKTGTYFFKNDQSITENTWQSETLDIRD